MNRSSKRRLWFCLGSVGLFVIVLLGYMYLAPAFVYRSELSSSKRMMGPLVHLDYNKVSYIIVSWPELAELKKKPIVITEIELIKSIIEEVNKISSEEQIDFSPDQRKDRLTFCSKNGGAKSLSLIDLNHGREIGPVLRSDKLAVVVRKAITATLAKK